MKVVILAGGYGTRIGEETIVKPKPMLEIGGKPILWHIMKIFSTYKIDEFIICCGYKGNLIKKYFNEFNSESWDVKTVDTGLDTMTGGRIKKIQNIIENNTFCLTYGDDLKKINIKQLINFHEQKNKMVTMTVTQPKPRFGIVKIKKDQVVEINEKSIKDEKWINGGYFVLEPNIFDFIKGDDSIWENESLKKLSKSGQVSAFKYYNEYVPMDTKYDKMYLEELWGTKKAYWKIWD